MKFKLKVKALAGTFAAALMFASSVFAAEPARLVIAELPGGVSVLTDDEGRTLYANSTEEVCTGECAELWQPLLTVGRAAVGPGLVPGFIGSVERAEGVQVTFSGQPLYYFAGDTEPGDVLGQGIDDTWFVVASMGALHTDAILEAEEAVTDVAFELDEAVMQAGQGIYANFCAACHGVSGSGGGGGPAIAQGTNIGNTNYVLSQIIHGGAEMPSFGQSFDDEQVAAVSTFIRNSFGNSYPPISPEEAESAR